MLKRRLPTKYRRQAAILRKYANLDVDLRKAHSPQTKSRITRLWNDLSRMSGGTTGLVREYRPRSKKAKTAAARLSNQPARTWKTFFLQGTPDTKISYNPTTKGLTIDGKYLEYALAPLQKGELANLDERLEALKDTVAEQYPEREGRRYKPALAKGDFGGIPFRDSLDETINDIRQWTVQYKLTNVITGIMVMDVKDLQPWDEYKKMRKKTSRRRIKDNKTLWQDTQLIRKLM